MRRKEPNSKVHVISFRIDDQEKELLLEMAAKSGDSLSDLLRKRLNLPSNKQRQAQAQLAAANSLEALRASLGGLAV